MSGRTENDADFISSVDIYNAVLNGVAARGRASDILYNVIKHE